MKSSLAALLLTTAAHAATPSQLQHLAWRSIGPYRGGRVLAVAGDPQNPNLFYFGAVNGGIWRTNDAGRTWSPIADSLPVGSIGALAIAPSAPATLYAGTGEADMRSDIAQGRGLYRSTDAGQTWTPAGLADTQQIARILINPADPNTLLVAALGHPYGPNPQRGVFRSTDGGAHWTRTLFHDENTGAVDLAFQPGNPATVFAALWQTRRPPWNVYPPSSGPGSGLYRSTDGGQSWAPLTAGLPAAPARIGLATTAADPRRVYALVSTRAGTDGGLYRSDDTGTTWRRVSADKRILERAWYFSGITADPVDPDIVHVCDTIMLESHDAGAHFAAVLGDPTGDDFHALWIDPKNPQRRILGSDQGALVTLNGGQSWSSWFNQPTGQFYHVSTDNRFPYRVYGAQQDSGAASVASRHDGPFDGIGLQDFRESAAGGESDSIAPDPADPDTIYGGRVDRLDLRTGQMQNIDPTLATPDTYRATWTLPLVFGPDHALYFANQRIFRTTDEGRHWTAISPDLTREAPDPPATLDPATAADKPDSSPRRGVIYAIAPSPLNAAIIWAGTDDGLVWRTTDAGAHWSNVTPANLAPWSKIGTIEPSHSDPDTAYLAIDRHRLDDSSPYALRTNDAGRRWTPITEGLADPSLPSSLNVIREDPSRPGLLFAGAEHGAAISFNAGDAWQPLQNNLPPTSVRDITIHGNDIVIATHGRGFYILDDAASLRTLAAAPTAATRLFPPSDAIRLHPPSFTGTPMPKEEPAAANPPSGAIIDYELAATSAAPVDLTILDPQGKLVRRFRSDDPIAQPDPANATAAVGWLAQPPPPAATPGTHRLTWNLRYPAPAALASLDPPAEGILAPPGTYTVTLHAGAIEQQQTLTVLPDPRLKLAGGDLLAQFTLARAIEAAQVATQSALAKAATLLTRSPAAGAQEATARLTTLIGAHPDDPGASNALPPTPLGSLTDIAARLQKLAQAIGGADAAPTPDALTGFASASKALASALGQLK